MTNERKPRTNDSLSQRATLLETTYRNSAMRNEYLANQALAASAAQAKNDVIVASMQERHRRALELRVKAEMAESNSALLNVLMQTLGLIAVVAISYWLFIQFAGN